MKSFVRCWPFACLLTISLTGCGQSPPPQASRPPEKPKVEAELAYTTLSDTDAGALRIESRPVTTGAVQEHLQLTGWVMAPQGPGGTNTPPAAGYIRDPAKPGTPLPVAGVSVAARQELFSMEPVLSPLEQIQFATLKRDAEAALNKARETLKFAEVEVERARTLVKIKGQQVLDQAEVQVKHAREDQAAAEFKLSRFANPPVPIVAPRGGTVLVVHVSPGQYVPAAAPLVTLADLSTLWVRVPAPQNDLPAGDRRRPLVV